MVIPMTSLKDLAEPASLDPAGALLHSQKMAALGELASGITHDFRNILQTVISTLDMIESRASNPDEVKRLAASALKAAERGIGLTKRLLTFARRETPDPKPACLVPSLESVAETLARTFEARMNVGIEQPTTDLWPVIIDPTELELALINLGVNARDAMPQGGHIRLGAPQCNHSSGGPPGKTGYRSIPIKPIAAGRDCH